MKHLLKMSDLTREELFHILDVADELKADRKAGRAHPLLAGKSLALIFQSPAPAPAPAFRWVCTSWAAWPIISTP